MNSAGSYVSLDLKAVEDDGTFSGYASTFGNADQGSDVVVAGAFAKTLAQRPAAKIKMLRDHDPRQLVGQWLDAKEDRRGLFVKGKLLLEVAAAQEAYALLKAGALDASASAFARSKIVGTARRRFVSSKKLTFARFRSPPSR